VCDVVLGELSETRQRESGVVLAEIRAHPIEAAIVHQIGFLEAGLADEDVVGGH
jgi:hypothetical protein